MVTRVSTFAQSSLLTSSNMRLQSQYAEKQLQVSTGLKSSSYEDIASDSAKLLSLESYYSEIVSKSENAQTALDRTEVTYSKIGSIIDVGTSLLDDLNAAISGTGTDNDALVISAEESLAQIVSFLNSQTANRYSFSGSATNTAAVDLDSYTGTSGVTLPTVADTSYYQGNDYTQSVELADGYDVNYGVTADDSAFEEIIRALDLVTNYDTVVSSDTTLTAEEVQELALTEAYDLLEQAIDDLEVLKAQVSQSSQTLDNFIEDSLTELDLIETTISDITAVDLTEAAVELQELEAQLEASYSVTTKLLELNLADYI